MRSDTLVLQYSLQASIAELASTAVTDVGMHGLFASQSCYHSVLPHVYVHCGPVVDFFITKQTSLHPFDFVRNLSHLLVLRTNIRCVESLNISVDVAKMCKIFTNSPSTHFLSVTKNDYSCLKDLFMVSFKLIRMLSYAKNKLQMC